MSLHAMHIGQHIHCGNWLLRIVEATESSPLTMVYIYESPLGSQEEPRYCGQVEVPPSMRNLDQIARHALDCAVRGGQDDRGIEAKHTRMLVHGSQIRRRAELDQRQCWVLREADGREFGTAPAVVPEPQPEPAPKPAPEVKPEPEPIPVVPPEPSVKEKRQANMAKAHAALAEKRKREKAEREAAKG